jgi:exopolyphosphatase/guanosine-5'-triphosphate,3'-diphosphate pyrophosphatase
MRVAVVDLGTNSTRLLVADVHAGRAQEVERRTTVTRLGDGVDATGRLDEEAVVRVHAALAEYRRLIDEHGAERVTAVATSAVRDAANGEEFRRGLAERFGIDARTISGEQEAALTFAGATAGRPEGDGPLLVLDIGGGSTEFVIGVTGREPDFSVSLKAGSVRHTERHLREPPSSFELAALRAAVRGLIASKLSGRRAAGGIAVAGTPTSLAAIDQRLDPYDPDRVHGYVLPLERCEQMLGELAGLPLELRRQVTGLHPDRAPTIVAGVAILVEAMSAFGLTRIEVSEADILHGAAISLANG